MGWFGVVLVFFLGFLGVRCGFGGGLPRQVYAGTEMVAKCEERWWRVGLDGGNWLKSYGMNWEGYEEGLGLVEVDLERGGWKWLDVVVRMGKYGGTEWMGWTRERNKMV